MKIYLSIPMSGHADLNEPRARAIASQLVEEDGCDITVTHDVTVPAHPGRSCPDPGYPGAGSHTGLCYLRESLREMLRCDAVMVAPGWEHSRGCRAEVQVALLVGMEVREWRDFSPVTHVPGT